ncbi:MAG: PIG-L deacetylase family protein [Acetobacteraceae bacterium]
MSPDAGRSGFRSRRLFLTGLAGSAVGIHGVVRADTPRSSALNIVVTGGHPGDPEYGCGGTVARYTKQGHRVTLLYLNRGEDPHEGGDACSAAIAANRVTPRVHEAMSACRILGATPVFSPQCNGASIVDNAHYEAFTELLATLRPDVIFTQWPIDNHPDHRATFTLTLEAWSRLGRKAAFYFYEVSDGLDTLMFTPTDYVDITEAEPLKRSACYAHASQQPDFFYALQSHVSEFRGTESGCRHAEAYVRHVGSPPGLLP